MRFIRHVAVAVVTAGLWAASAGSASALPTIDMLTDMQFGNGNHTATSNLECQPILIADDGTNFTVANDIRLIIPTTYSMAWATDTSAEVLLSGTVVVSGTVSYASPVATQTVCVLAVTTPSAAGDKIVVTGISFTNWTAVETLDSLGMSYDGTTTEQVPANQGFCTAGVRLSSANNFSFTPTGSAGASGDLPAITITDDTAAASITAAADIDIIIPAFGSYGTAPTFNTGVLTVTVTGADSNKVSGTVSYPNSRTCRIDVTTDFVAGSTITISGLRFTIDTGETYTADSLQLSRNGSANIHAVDDKVFAVGPPNITMATVYTASANGNDLPVPKITITDHASTPTITAVSDIRLVIISTNTSDLTATGRDNLSWDTTATSAIYTGTASGKVSGNPTAADTGNGAGKRLLLIKVDTNFAAGDVLIVDGLKGDNALATATQAYIGLVIAGYTANDVTKAFGRVVNFVSTQVTGGVPAGDPAGNGSCFLRAAEREAAQ